ncbi:uncharacterized protein LOC134449372 [Engraulis encrasicolus]|uniref:uncharacterized protein LOC134449372 n=1 Tax=Engraulis encrasicolus TaxID=184585 RepID=UPI002FD70F58
MALRNANGPGRLSSPQPRFVKLDKKTQKNVAAIVDNLSTEQWATLTTGLDDVTKKDFTKICVGIVRDLTETTYKMCRPATTQKRMKEIASSKSSPAAPDLESPKTNAFVAEIVNEVKQALSSVLNSSPQTSSPSDGTSTWNTLFSHLEEQISTELMVRLEASDFFTRHRESSMSEEPDSKVDEVGEAADYDKEACSELPEDTAEPEQETTACTNDIICEMYDTYQMSQEEEEARLKAAAVLDSEVSLATDHFVDSVMEDLRELASGRKVPAFRWVPKNLRLPPVTVAAAADPAIFTPQFRLAAQLKVSRILAQSESMSGEGPPSARAAASAKDIVGTLVKSLSKTRQDDDVATTSRSAQQIYHNLESKVTDFLRGKPSESDMDYNPEERSADSDRDFDPSLKPQTSLQDRETPFQRAMGWFGRFLFQDTPEPSTEDLTGTQDDSPGSTSDATGSEASAAQNDWPEVKQLNSQSAVEVQPQSPPPQSAPSPLTASVETPSAPRAQSPTPARARPVNHILMMCCIRSPDMHERGRRGEGVPVAGRSPPTAQQRTMNNILKVLCCINSPDTPVRGPRGESVLAAGRSQEHNQGHTSGRSSRGRDVAEVKVIVDNEGSFSAH